MLEIELSPLLDQDNRLRDIQRLPDIIDLRFGNKGLSFYFYPVVSWSWRFYTERMDMSYNNLLPWVCRYCFELHLPTITIEFALS